MTNFYSSTKEALEDPLCPDVFAIGTHNNYKLYLIDGEENKEIALFLKHVRSRPAYDTYRDFKSAINNVEDGGYVGIGFPNAQLIYRVNKKNYNGNPEDLDNVAGCFNFIYHFNK